MGFLLLLAQIIYNLWTYQLYNVLYTFMPIALYAVFDKDDDYKKLEDDPNCYKIGFTGKLFSSMFFWFCHPASFYGVLLVGLRH